MSYENGLKFLSKRKLLSKYHSMSLQRWCSYSCRSDTIFRKLWGWSYLEPYVFKWTSTWKLEVIFDQNVFAFKFTPKSYANGAYSTVVSSARVSFDTCAGANVDVEKSTLYKKHSFWRSYLKLYFQIDISRANVILPVQVFLWKIVALAARNDILSCVFSSYSFCDIF